MKLGLLVAEKKRGQTDRHTHTQDSCFISIDLKIGTLFINVSYMCDPSFIQFSGTRITIMPLKFGLKVIKRH